MKKEKKSLSLGELFGEFFLLPFKILEGMVIGIYIIAFVSIILTGIVIYDSYKSPKCTVCNRQVEIGEYCKHCGILMTDSTTYKNKLVHPWEIIE